MNVYDYILTAQHSHRPILAVLLDPEKNKACHSLLPYVNSADIILIGGSTGTYQTNLINQLREYTSHPVVLFPGNVTQFTAQADALLFLSVLTARSADVLIEPQIQAAMPVRNSGIETIPMGYILIDGGRKSSVEVVTHSKPLPQSDIPDIVSTAIAGELLGKHLIYLEAGSGAKQPIAPIIIREVRQHVSVPLIVGGGICHPQQMIEAYEAGADIVVIGNYFEQHPEQLPLFMAKKNLYANSRH